MDETPYLIEIDAADRGGSPVPDLEDESINGTGDEEADDAQHSPIVEMSDEAWAALDDELAEFMDETDTDGASESDTESVRSESSTVSDTKQAKKKRKRTSSREVSEAEESDSSVNSTSQLQRRKKRTMERVTSLTNVVSADKSTGLPSPETTGPEEEQGEDEDKAVEANGVAPDLEEEYDDALEAELLAGFGDSGSDGEEG